MAGTVAENALNVWYQAGDGGIGIFLKYELIN